MTTEGRVTSEAELAQLREEVARLRTACKQTLDEVELLRAERAQLLEQQQRHVREIDSLQHQLQQLLRRLFGRSAEKIDPKQMVLFEALLNQLAPPTPAPAPAVESAPTTPRPANHGHGRRRLPSVLPRRKVIHDLSEAEKPCPCCGAMRHVIGQEVSEQLNYVPAQFTVVEHVRLKYACRACEEKAAEGGPQIVTAEKPLSPIEKGLAAPGLLAHVIVSKYGDHLPLHRLEHILARQGIQIARSTMGDWAAQCATLLRPLYDRMVEEVLRSKVIHTDDTPVKVQDRARVGTRTGRFWVYLGDPCHPYTVFAYTPSRSRDGPQQFLQGWSGYLQADAFGGYDGIYAGQAGGRVTEVACWAHARRKFYDARSSDAAVSTQALAYIRLLYDVEVEAKQRVEALEKEQAGRDEDAASCSPDTDAALYATRGGAALYTTHEGAALPTVAVPAALPALNTDTAVPARDEGEALHAQDAEAALPTVDVPETLPAPAESEALHAHDAESALPTVDVYETLPAPAADVALPTHGKLSPASTAGAASLQQRRAEMIRALRQEKSVPRLAQFKAWLETQQAVRGGPVLPKSPLGEAITYTFNQWDALTVYTTDGDLAIDNNASENALRRVALGRKNWLFCGSDHGGTTAAVLFSLLATCQRHQVEPFTYLGDVLTRIAATPVNQLAALLPARCSPAN